MDRETAVRRERNASFVADLVGCRWCERPYWRTPDRWMSVCSPGCRRIARNRRQSRVRRAQAAPAADVDLTCIECGTRFVCSAAYAAKKKYCSEQCRRTVNRRIGQARRNEPITKRCLVCSNEFVVSGHGHDKHRVYCSQPCATTSRAARRRHQADRDRATPQYTCDVCGGTFEAQSYNQKRCITEKMPCGFCGTRVDVVMKRFLRKTKNGSPPVAWCDNTCQLLHRRGSKVPLDKLADFKDQAGWAQRFARETGHRPTRGEFLMYFNAAPSTVPRREALPFFAQEADSRWEQQVVNHIAATWGLAITRNRKPLAAPTGGRWQLDVWLEDLFLAFEVQDLKTHSRTSDDEPGLGGRPKNGPTYHALKQRLAAEQLGVTVVEIWQDAIEDGSFKRIVDDAIRTRIPAAAAVSEAPR